MVKIPLDPQVLLVRYHFLLVIKHDSFLVKFNSNKSHPIPMKQRCQLFIGDIPVHPIKSQRRTAVTPGGQEHRQVPPKARSVFTSQRRHGKVAGGDQRWKDS